MSSATHSDFKKNFDSSPNSESGTPFAIISSHKPVEIKCVTNGGNMRISFSDLAMNILGGLAALTMCVSLGMAMTNVSNDSAIHAVNAFHSSTSPTLPAFPGQTAKVLHKHKKK